MAGKSNKGKNRRGSSNSVNSNVRVNSSDAPLKENLSSSEPSKVDKNGNATMTESTQTQAKLEVKGSEKMKSEPMQGEIHLYPVFVKTQGGEKFELQLSPLDSVMDVRQFLLDAPETCFFTCYDLVLCTKDGSAPHLEDYNEISEVADITTGDCSLEMVAASYDDRSIRVHFDRARQLLSVSSPYTSVSTLLVLQHETGQGTRDSAKPQVSELENLGYMEDVSGSLTNLLSSPSNELKCVESLVFSSFNPPPRHRRLSGDLIYLDVITLEGNKYCITGTTKTFYINSSTGNVLDPRPNKAVSEATTLIGLLQKISPKFKKAFREILEQKASAHPFEIVQAPLSPNSWIGLYPVPDHKRDAARAENALTLSFGSELIGMQRDWNEELQSCWEFPHVTSQERILRERALYKVSSDFVDAATSGAIGVINRCIPPINPADPECFHMYVHNNIFFSFAVDADLEQLKKQASDANLKAEEGVEALQISIEKATNKSLHCTDKSNGSSTGEHNVIMDLATDVTSETQLAESEQATYASANNDLKGTRAFQEADIPGLYNLAMAIIDYRGHRVVAQSVLPGILQGDKSDSLLYGSVDNGKKVSWNEEFHSKVLEASKRLHLKEHTVLDGSGNVFKLAAPMECKGIIGSDDRHYLLDLMRVTPRDANYTGPADRFCILRPELITTLCQAEEAERLKSKCRSEGEVSVAMDSPKVDNTEEHGRNEDTMTEQKVGTSRNCGYQPSGSGEILEEILFNPNVLMGFKLAGSPEELHVDEDNVRKASTYLRDFVLPKFVQDLCSLEVSPMDGHTLTEALHAHGINVRYIGKIADGTKQLPHLWDLCSNEIVVRSAKHILKDILRDTEDHDLSKAISHFLNCFFGYYQAVDIEGVVNSTQSRKQKKDHGGRTSSGKYSRGQGRWKNTISFKKKQSSYMLISSDSLWSDIQEFAKLKYQFELPEDARSRIKKISVIRNFCQKVGITIAGRKYDFDNLAPFQTSDILNLQPVVKQSVPVCSEAKVLVETGKAQLAEGMLTEAYKLFSEAFTILQQVTGPMHREVANCCRYLAMVLYHAGDMAGAIMQQHKELIINERCLGLDHPDTAHSYGNMALFYHGLNQTELALRHMSRALLLLSLSSGPDHPDVASTYINVAMMYQDIGKMNTALRYLQEALKKNERLLGEEHIHTAVCYHALAIAFNCMGAYKLSHQHEKKTYEILVKQLGEEDSRTQDSKNWMNTFKKREAQLNAQKQKGQALDAASAQKAIDILKANPDLIHAFQTAATGGGVVNSTTLNAAIMGDPLPRGRGVDERAARATAEVRKKAAARGLLIRPHGVPIQTLPPVTHLLNAINSGMTPEAMNSEETDGKKKEVNGHPCDKPARDAQENKSELGQQDQGPVGLGTGLAVLNSKKQKPKAEVTS